MKTTPRILLAVLLLIGSNASAQPPRVILSLEEAISYTISENPALKAAAYNLYSATQERRAMIGLRMPQIQLVGNYTYLSKEIGLDFNHLKTPLRQIGGGLVSGGVIGPQLSPMIQELVGPLMEADWNLKLQDRSFGFVGGEVTMPIWLGGKINAANRAAKLNERSAEAQGVQTRNALISQLVERYFGLALAQQVIAVQEQVVAGVRRHLNDAIALEQNGVIAPSERLYVAFQLAEAERALEGARLEAQTLCAALSTTLGVEGAWQPVTAMFVVEDLGDMAYFQQLAQAENPLLQQITLQRALAEEGVRAQRAEFLPQVVAMGGGSFYNYQVSGLVPRWAVGVGVSLKLFDGLRREYKYAATKQTARRVEELREEAESEIALLVEKQYNQLLNYRNQLTAIEASLHFAEEYLRLKQASFKEGICSASELIDAELNVAKVRTERLQAAYHFDLSLAQLLESAGISDTFGAYPRRADARTILFHTTNQ